MKKFLFLCLLVSWFNVAAQDERRVVDGREYPIWYSRGKVLVKFKDPARYLRVRQPDHSKEIIEKLKFILE